MELITWRSALKEDIEIFRLREEMRGLWIEQENYWTNLLYGENKRIAIEKLSKLNLDTCTLEDASNIVGFKLTGSRKCGECENPCTELVEIGEPPDDESKTAYLCLDCLKKAVALFPSK